MVFPETMNSPSPVECNLSGCFGEDLDHSHSIVPGGFEVMS